MAEDQAIPEHEEEPILSIIQQIKDGRLNPKTIPKETRQQCIGVLLAEGYTESAIAQILSRSEKTISRDLAELRVRNALTPDINLAKQIVGDMFQKAMAHHKYLMRLARATDASYGEKAQSEYLAWRVLREAVEKMQTLGYLPIKPQEVVSDIYHHNEGGDKKTYDELRKDLQDIERVAIETGTLDLKIQDGIKLLQQRIAKAEIVEEIAELNKSKDSVQNNREDGHEQ